MAKKKLTLSNLKTQKTPMLKTTVQRTQVGKNFGLTLQRFIHRLFELNEQKPKAGKMTDGEIARQIKVEFGHVPKYAEKYDVKKNPKLSEDIKKHRSAYNRGMLVTAKRPPSESMVSFCYDEEGFPVNPRFETPKRLTADEIKKFRQKFQKYRDEFEKSRNRKKND